MAATRLWREVTKFGPILSSVLIEDAETALHGHSMGPDGMLTYVWDARIRSANPGYCFKCAGWSAIGRSADGRKTLLQKLPPDWSLYLEAQAQMFAHA